MVAKTGTFKKQNTERESLATRSVAQEVEQGEVQEVFVEIRLGCAIKFNLYKKWEPLGGVVCPWLFLYRLWKDRRETP